MYGTKKDEKKIEKEKERWADAFSSMIGDRILKWESGSVASRGITKMGYSPNTITHPLL